MQEQIQIKEKRKKMLQEQRYLIVEMFAEINNALPLSYMFNTLKKYYPDPGWIIRDAILEGIIYVDRIDNKIEVFFGLNNFGEDLWRQRKGR